MVTGSTKLVGIIGNPVSHSLSPAMHNLAFQTLAMNWIYLPLPVPPDHLAEAVKGLDSLGFLGANVTVPYKEQVIPFLDELSDEAARIGAVNTIKVQEGRLLGQNTDSRGFLNHLAELGFDPLGCQALILGSGGSARAVAYALASQRAAIRICGRNATAACAVVDRMKMLFPEAHTEYLSWDDLGNTRAEVDIVVNTTPVGMAQRNGASPWPPGVCLPTHGLVYDLVYNPPLTGFMEQARENGIPAANGMGMLIHQAGLSFEIWTGIQAPLEIMRKAVTSC
jgi:shikimate dehydrogenase